MSVLAQVIVALGVVITSAVTRINAVVFGQHFSVPPIGLLFAAIALVLTVMAKAHLSLPAPLAAVGLGRLMESGPRYRTAPDRSTS